MAEDGALPTGVQEGVRSRPRSVTWAFWLWWPQIISQALTVIGAVVASVGALVVGGPALDVVIFAALPLGLPVAAVTALEVWLLFRLRSGSRRARTVLAILAVGSTALAIWSAVFQVLMRLPGSGTVISAQEGPGAAYGQLALSALLATAMLIATVLTFTRSARAFFDLRGPDDTQTGPSATAGDAPAEGEATSDLTVPNPPE